MENSQPAVAWLAATWHALTGMEAPLSAEFILADNPAAGWPGCGQDKWLLAQWTRLRVATLGSIWRVRCLAEEGAAPPGGLARAAARMATESLCAAVARDWARVEGNVRSLDASTFSANWWRGPAVDITVGQFRKQWAAQNRPPVFCTVTEPQPGRYELAMRLGVGTPTPLPPLPPGPAGG